MLDRRERFHNSKDKKDSSERIIGAASVATELRVKDPLNYANNFFAPVRGAIILIFNLFLFVLTGIRKHFSVHAICSDLVQFTAPLHVFELHQTIEILEIAFYRIYYKRLHTIIIL